MTVHLQEIEIQTKRTIEQEETIIVTMASSPSSEDMVARLEAVMADPRPHWPDQQIIRQSGGGDQV